MSNCRGRQGQLRDKHDYYVKSLEFYFILYEVSGNILKDLDIKKNLLISLTY